MMLNILSMGSRGDVQPYCVLGAALQAAGHPVQMLVPENFESFVAQFGLDCVPLAGDIRAMMESPAGKAIMKTRNPIKLGKDMRAFMGPVMKECAQQVVDACADGECALIMSNLSALVGASVAEAVNIPTVMTTLQPLAPAREYFSAMMPQPPIPLPSVINRLSAQISFKGFWQVMRPMVNNIRHDLFHLPPLPRFGYLESYQDTSVLCGFSKHVIPKSADWHDKIHLTGYWFYENGDEYDPPADLLDFLANGAPPVYIGFGSMQNDDPAETAALAIRALALSGQRGVLLSGWGGLETSDLPETVYALRETSHDWLFQRMGAIVHHGGAGTTAAALRSGRPSVVVPFFADQPFWGARVHKLGVGARPVSRRKLTAERLAEAITFSLQECVGAADALGRRLRAENGAHNAVAHIERLLGIGQ